MTDWAEEWGTIDLVKQTVTLVEIVEMFGFEIDQNDKIRPPWRPDERTPSCHIYIDHYYDYGSGEYGDLFNFIKKIQPEDDLKTIISAIWNRALRSGREPGDVPPEVPRDIVDFTDEVQMYPLDPVRFPLGIRLDGDTALIPHREPGLVYGVKTRGPAGKRAWPGSQFTHRLYDPHGWNNTHAGGMVRDVVICEGESDSWAMDRATSDYVNVLALPAGASAWKDHWLKDLNGYDNVWLCMDNDRAGDAALTKLTGKIGYERARALKVPQLYNDAREAIEAGWEPRIG